MCGVAGITGHTNAVDHCITALLAIQGRGAQASGMAAPGAAKRLRVVKALGPVTNLKQLAFARLNGAEQVIGHIRYATAESSGVKSAHPFVSRNRLGALAHNGEITDANRIRQQLIEANVKLDSACDSELVMRLIETNASPTPIGRVLSVLNGIDQAYSIVMLYEGLLIGACDRHATHPLALGRFHANGGHILASENSAITTVGAISIRDIAPGEVIVISPNQAISSYQLEGTARLSHCSLNLAYTARPDSTLWGLSVSQKRKEMGYRAFRQMVNQNCLPEVDIIAPVLDSGRNATLAFAKAYDHRRSVALIERDGLEAFRQTNPQELYTLDYAIYRAHYGRNFQLSTEEERALHILLKHGIDENVVAGKRILIGDDTIVRSTTIRHIISVLRKFGSTEVHVVAFAPPIFEPCPYGGCETKKKVKLIANQGVDQVAERIGANSVFYLPLNDYQDILGSDFCYYCHQRQNSL